jgi:hypothetical protein
MESDVSVILTHFSLQPTATLISPLLTAFRVSNGSVLALVEAMLFFFVVVADTAFAAFDLASRVSKASAKRS